MSDKPYSHLLEDYEGVCEEAKRLEDRIEALEAENKALRDCLAKIAHNPSECTTGEGHAHAVFLARDLLAKDNS